MMTDSEVLDEEPISFNAFLQKYNLPQTELTEIIFEIYIKQNRKDKDNGINNQIVH